MNNNHRDAKRFARVIKELLLLLWNLVCNQLPFMKSLMAAAYAVTVARSKGLT